MRIAVGPGAVLLSSLLLLTITFGCRVVGTAVLLGSVAIPRPCSNKTIEFAPTKLELDYDLAAIAASLRKHNYSVHSRHTVNADHSVTDDGLEFTQELERGYFRIHLWRASVEGREEFYYHVTSGALPCLFDEAILDIVRATITNMGLTTEQKAELLRHVRIKTEKRAPWPFGWAGTALCTDYRCTLLR